MARTTRTLDGTISRVKYDYSTLRLNGENKSLSTRPRNHRSRRTKEKVRFDAELLKESIPEPPREDICEGINFIPPTAFGDVQPVGLSAIGHAERRIAQWEIIRDAHKKNLPYLLPQIDERMREAREVRQNLLNDQVGLEANSSVVYNHPCRITWPYAKLFRNQEKRNKKVADRIAVLEDTLRTSEFTPEAQNIQAAIDGYRNGDIRYSTQYTLIWNG